VKLRAVAAGSGGADLHYAWIIGFLGQHKNEMENKQLLGSEMIRWKDHGHETE
jgi:hypothetical protein